MDLLGLLIGVVLVLVAVGVLLWLVKTAPFVDAELKPVIRWVVLAVTALYLLGVVFGQVPFSEVGPLMADETPQRRAEDQPQSTVTKVKNRTLAVAFLSFSIAFFYQLSEILKRHSDWSQLQAPAGVGEILFALVCGLLAIGTALGLDLQSLVKGFTTRKP